MSIANNLRQLRLNCGMTQEQAAEKIGVTRQAVSSYEAGRTCPDIDMLLRLSEVYGTDIDGVLYGENRALKLVRIVKISSISLGVVITVLTIISSAFLWSANRFFAVPVGQLSSEEKLLLESHVCLTKAWEAIDGVILTIAMIGFIILVALLAVWKCRIPMKTKGIYIAALTGAIFLISVLFGITDSVFSAINYLITPMHVAARLFILFIIHLIIEFLQKRRCNQPEQQDKE